MASIVDILPLEVIEHIIDLLASDEHYKSGPHEPFQFPTVKACALTCKAFYPRSSYQRFRAIKVYDRNGYPDPGKGSILLDEFKWFVRSRPESACRVLELHYSIRVKLHRPAWIDDAVPRNLSNLQSLVFSPYGGNLDWARNIPWHSPQVSKRKDALLQILHLPTLVSFKLSRTTNFRPSDLFLCTNLQSLSLQSVSVWPDEDDERAFRIIPVINPASICLRHLEVGRSAINTVAGMLEPAAPEGCPVLDLQDLKELTIKGGLQPEYFLSTEKIFKQAPQLESLRLKVGRQKSESGVKYYIPMITERLNTLTSLSIDLYLSGPTSDDEDTEDGDPLEEDHFESLMTTLLFFVVQFSRNKLKSFQVQIRFGPTYNGWCSDKEWATLGGMFDLRDTWTALTHFDLALIVQGKTIARKLIVERLSRLPDTHLSELSSQKSFKFTFFCGKEGEYVPRTMEY